MVFALSLIILLVGCEGMSVSTAKYDEIKEFVKNNADKIQVTGDVEFFTYKTTGISIGAVYYGYYYSENNEVLLPDYYRGNDDIREPQAKDGGAYFGRPNNGTDWCFVKQISDHWFYYELHWA